MIGVNNQYSGHLCSLLVCCWYLSTVDLFPTTTKPELHDCDMNCVLFIEIIVVVQTVFLCVLFIYACVLSCSLVCWPAWLSWRSAWPWTVTTPSYWLSPRSRYLYRSDTPPASGERRCVQRRTHGTLRLVPHQEQVQSNKAAGGKIKKKTYQNIGKRNASTNYYYLIMRYERY